MMPVDARAFFFGANLIALLKVDNSLRPVACGDVLRRLASKIVAKAEKPNFKELFQEAHQVGIAVPGGAEATIALARRYGACLDHTRAIVKFDLRNAFNEFSRIWMLSEIHDILPGAYNILKAAYAQHSWLRFGMHTILSQEGGQQGDPLAGIAFCVVLARCTLEIKEILRSEGLALDLESWYMDDGTAGARADHLRRFFDLFQERGPRYGLHLNLRKCEVIATCDEVFDLFPEIPNRCSPDCWSLLGAPVGRDRDRTLVWAQEILDAMARKNRVLSATVTQVELPLEPKLHIAYVLLRFCGGTALTNFLCRCVGWFPGLIEYDRDLRRCVERVAGPLDDNQWQMVNFRFKLGGGGMALSQPTASIAYVASCLESSNLAISLTDNSPFLRLATHFKPLSRLISDVTDLDPGIASYNYIPADRMATILATQLPEDGGPPVPSKIQKVLTREYEGRIHAAFLTRILALDSAWAVVALRRFAAAAQRGSGAFLINMPDVMTIDSDPSGPMGNRFSPWLADELLLCAFSLRFSRAITAEEKACPFCFRRADIYGDHILNCLKGGERGRASAYITWFVEQIGRRAGFPVQHQPCPFSHAPSDRLDCAIQVGGTKVLVDVAMTHAKIGRPGEYESVKQARYSEGVTLERLTSGVNMVLFPVVFDTMGGLSPHADQLMAVCARATALRHGLPRAHATNLIRQQINCTVVRTSAGILLRQVNAMDFSEVVVHTAPARPGVGAALPFRARITIEPANFELLEPEGTSGIPVLTPRTLLGIASTSRRRTAGTRVPVPLATSAATALVPAPSASPAAVPDVGAEVPVARDDSLDAPALHQPALSSVRIDAPGVEGSPQWVDVQSPPFVAEVQAGSFPSRSGNVEADAQLSGPAFGFPSAGPTADGSSSGEHRGFHPPIIAVWRASDLPHRGGSAPHTARDAGWPPGSSPLIATAPRQDRDYRFRDPLAPPVVASFADDLPSANSITGPPSDVSSYLDHPRFHPPSSVLFGSSLSPLQGTVASGNEPPLRPPEVRVSQSGSALHLAQGSQDPSPLSQLPNRYPYNRPGWIVHGQWRLSRPRPTTPRLSRSPRRSPSPLVGPPRSRVDSVHAATSPSIRLRSSSPASSPSRVSRVSVGSSARAALPPTPIDVAAALAVEPSPSFPLADTPLPGQPLPGPGGPATPDS